MAGLRKALAGGAGVLRRSARVLQAARARRWSAPRPGTLTDFTAKAPSPIRAWARAATARKAGYSQPPFGALNTHPLEACTKTAPRSTGSRATETRRP